MRAVYSQREKNLIVTLGFKDLLQEKDPKVTYSTLALFCFSCGMTGPVADSVRRCYNAIMEGKPIRFTGAFDGLIKLPTTAWARDNRNYCVMEVDNSVSSEADGADGDFEEDSEEEPEEEPEGELELSPPEDSAHPGCYNTESRTVPVYRSGLRPPKRPNPLESLGKP